MAADFYRGKRWQDLRRRILARDGYMCQLSLRYGKRIPAEVVHHIFPLEDFPQYRYCSWNLISLSKEAHNALHNRATKTLTKEGRELMERTARKYGIDITEVRTNE